MKRYPPAEAEPDRTVVWLLLKAHHGTRNAARLRQEFLRNKVIMKAGWDALAVEANAHHKAGSLNDDDDANLCVHGDDLMVESRDRCDLRRESDVGVQGRHQTAGDHWTWSGHRSQDRETNLILESIRFHVESKSKTRARSDHVGRIGTVESSSADAEYSCNDEDNEKCIGLYHRREARRPISHLTGQTLSTASAEQTKTLQSRRCAQQRD